MSTAPAIERATPVAAPAASRVVSIDIFRGLTMAAMIFVNALSDERGLPWWTFHAHASQDVMTYVDMVFPFFLFIVGMSMPLSVEQRLKRDPSQIKLWLHVVLRSASLVGLGLILANAERADRDRMGINGAQWALLGLISGALYLNIYPKSLRFPHYATILRAVGLAGVVVTFAIFRSTTPDGHAAWIDPSYPEILGLIGFTYFAAALLYIPTRRWRWAAPAWFILMIALCACSTAHVFGMPVRLPWWFWPFDNGVHVFVVLGGVIAAQIFLGLRPGFTQRPAPKTASLAAIAFAIIAFVAGWIAIPLGISKIRGTPTWGLWSVAAAVLVFTLLYWICDQRRHTAWAFLLQPAGSNTLTTYLLPDFWDFILGALGITWLDRHFNLGWQDVVKTLVFTLLMLELARLLTRAKIRLGL